MRSLSGHSYVKRAPRIEEEVNFNIIFNFDYDTYNFVIFIDVPHKGLNYVLMQHGKVFAYALQQLKEMR